MELILFLIWLGGIWGSKTDRMWRNVFWPYRLGKALIAWVERSEAANDNGA